jgi:hypothetical protein
MSNWTSLTLNDLKDSGHGAIVDAAQATAVGTADPVSRIISDVIARLRAALSAAGNQLDQDTTKIPNSLKDIGARMAFRQLKTRINVDLTQDERDQRKEDSAYLDQIVQNKIRFELPDNPAATNEMQRGSAAQVVQTNKCNRPTDADKGRVSSRDRLRGL